ncbi:hypothetical protein ORI89_17445 [Sphingobacterium sp. UT-1RO-CII-1]|uniref:hypothetical protein n=1 Tax=Sphingobacterium sp. UT-1RO-CII-1 TaxID=2995225 RepID=UPI00227B72B5|nr:hypothetical protein [Sphingobacterium sp. UT-1RO-CII-1]MCY4781448.1 hypothetical protein [Sphingobacterium sp. UT-1RO-CII-1]
MRKNILTIIIITITSLCSFGQDYGKISELDIKNGFKTIVLGDSVSNYKDFKLIGPGEQDSEFYEGSSVGLNIGDVSLKSIAIATFRERISRIIVFFDPADGYKIKDILNKAYGLYTDKPNRFMDKFEWSSPKVRLTLDYDNRSDKGSMIFSSKEVVNEESDFRDSESKRATEDL